MVTSLWRWFFQPYPAGKRPQRGHAGRIIYRYMLAGLGEPWDPPGRANGEGCLGFPPEPVAALISAEENGWMDKQCNGPACFYNISPFQFEINQGFNQTLSMGPVSRCR